MFFKLLYLNSNFAQTLGYLNPALNNPALELKRQIRSYTSVVPYNGAKTIPFGVAHTCMSYIREYLFSWGGGGLDPSFYARRPKQVRRVTSLSKSPRRTGTQQHSSHWLNQKQSIKITSSWSSLINSFYLNPPSLSLNEYI